MYYRKTYKKIQKNILKFASIGLVFVLLSCGREGTQQEVQQEAEQGEPVVWYTKLGFKEVCNQMKNDTQLLTKRLNFSEFEEAEMLCNKISSTFGKLNTNSPNVPEEYFEFKERFEKSMANVLTVCKEKDSETAEAKLKTLKHSCKYCHKVFRRELTAVGYEKDFGVALDKLYKDK